MYKIKELEKSLANIEKLKETIMMQINYLENDKRLLRPIERVSSANTKLLEINGYKVMQLSYDGLVPHYLKEEKDEEYVNLIDRYYYYSTLKSYDFEKLKWFFSNGAEIIICQYFKDKRVRKLENRNITHIINAIRCTNVIKNDDWKNISYSNRAYEDKEKNHVQVYIVAKKDVSDFLKFLEDNHKRLKNINDSIVNQEEYLKNNRPIKFFKLFNEEAINDKFFW